jgi:hypothetical protein
VGAGTQCLSTGNDSIIGNGPGSDASETAANSNTMCPTALVVSGQRPGDSTEVTMNLANLGNVGATLSAYGGGSCASAASAVDTNFHGTDPAGADICKNVQFVIEQTSPTTACKYGRGASGVLNGSAITFPITVTNGTDDSFKLTVDGTVKDNIDFRSTTRTYASTATDMAALADDINIAFAANSVAADAAVGPDSILYISSNSVGGGSTVAIAAPGNGFSALTTIGMASGTTATTGGLTTCSYDAVHNVDDYVSNYSTSANGLSLGGLNVSITNVYKLRFQLGSGADNQLQGRKATFDLTWLLG